MFVIVLINCTKNIRRIVPLHHFSLLWTQNRFGQLVIPCVFFAPSVSHHILTSTHTESGALPVMKAKTERILGY